MLILDFQQTGLFCIPVSGWGWVMADSGRISGGVNYLQGIQANCNIGAGPGACSRVSCSYDSAIYYCNDVSYSLLIPLSTPSLQK
jgi:hypothetical protein